MTLIVRRFAGALPLCIIVSLLTYLIVNILPGNTAEQIAGADATPEQVARIAASLGLDRPVWERYFEWLMDALAGNLGVSLTSGQPVAALVGERLPVTIELSVLAVFVAIILALPLALLAARRPRGTWDRLGTVVSMTSISMASYIVGPMLIWIFAINLRALPSLGFSPLSEGVAQNLISLFLPTISIALPLFGLYTRFLRSDLLEQLGSDYVTTARMKGLGPWRVLLRHALPNSLFGMITIVGLNIGGLLGGAIVVEQIFAVPGVGQLLLEAIRLRDAPVIQTVVVLLAMATVMANLLVDVLYAALDPRVRYHST
jgi:peptide/nickel transport system permease protein